MSKEQVVLIYFHAADDCYFGRIGVFLIKAVTGQPLLPVSGGENYVYVLPMSEPGMPEIRKNQAKTRLR